MATHVPAGGDVVAPGESHRTSPLSRLSTCMPQEPATSDLLQASASTRICYTAYTAYTSTLYSRHTQYCILGTDTRTPAPGHWRPRHALENHRPNPSRVILLRCCISPRHLGNGTTRQYRLDVVTRVIISQAYFARIARRCKDSASCKACYPSPLDHTGGFLRARAHRTHLAGEYGLQFVTGDTVEGRHGGRGQPKPAAAASKQQRTQLTRGLQPRCIGFGHFASCTSASSQQRACAQGKGRQGQEGGGQFRRSQ